MTEQVGDRVTLRPDHGDSEYIRANRVVVEVIKVRSRMLLVKEVKEDGTDCEYNCHKDWWRILQLTEARQQEAV